MSAIRRNSTAVAGLALLGAMLLSGCSSTTTATVPPNQTPVQYVGTKAATSQPASSTPTAKKAAEAGHAIITITDSGVSPSTSTIKVGTRVVWSNTGSLSHAISIAGGPKSPAIKASGTASHVFKTPGTYAFSDPLHPVVHGTIIVKK